MRNEIPCTCGHAEPHVVARVKLADESWLSVWSDGDLTGILGMRLRGLGTPRRPWKRSARISAVRLLQNDLCRFDRKEIPRLIHIAEKTYSHTWSSDDMRRQFVLSRFFTEKKEAATNED